MPTVPDTAHRLTTLPTPVVFYDGPCGLCQWSVQWLLRKEREGLSQAERLHFAPLQGPLAAELLPADWRTPPLDGVVLAHPRLGLHRGAPALRALSGTLCQPWRTVLKFIPAWGYRWVARHRDRLARRFPSCALPSNRVV